MIWVDRNGKSRGGLSSSPYRCVCYTHPPLHPFVLAWNFRKERNKTIFLSHHYLVSVNAYISVNQQPTLHNSTRPPAFKAHLCHLLDARDWTSLAPSFSFWEMGLCMLLPRGGAFKGTWDDTCKAPSTLPGPEWAGCHSWFTPRSPFQKLLLNFLW